MKIAVLGGTGSFGRHLAEKFEGKHDVVISGSSLEKARKVAEERGWGFGENREIVSDSDVVVVSVPISVTVDVIEEVGPEVPRDCLFCDVTSVKRKPVEAMKKYSDEVLGMHPMYAPSNSIKGQKVVLCPEKGKRWKMMKEFWKGHGAEIHITDPGTHDTAMSIVQGLIHFSEMTVAETIRKSDMSPETMENYSSPVYKLLTDLTARMLNQRPRLYHSIQTENPENEKVRESFIESAEEIRELLGTDDFEEKFRDLGEEFDLKKAQERTDRVIEFLSGEGESEENKSDLGELREDIDRSDGKIADCVESRMETVKKIGEVKKKDGKNIRDRDREEAVKEKYRKLFEERDLPPERGEQVAELLIETGVDLQKEIL